MPDHLDVARDPTADDLARFMRFAEQLASATRKLIVESSPLNASHRLKADGSFVTDIDFAVEDLVRSRVQTSFPNHGIVGEERPDIPSSSDYQWVIDPIDGTHSFRHRIPLFGTLLALLHRGQPVLGVIDLPLLNRTYVGASGRGAFCNGQQVSLRSVRAANEIAHEVIAIGERRQFVACGHQDAFDRLMQGHQSVRTYCDCFGHALAIEGAVGAMVDYNLHLWDFAASEVLIREAGGVFVARNVDNRSDRRGGHYDVVFGKPRVVEWLSRVLTLPA